MKVKTDVPIMTGNHLRAARALAGVDQEYVARFAKVAIGTVRNMESSGYGPITSRLAIVQRVTKALLNVGIVFTGEKGEDGVARITGVKRAQVIVGVGFSEADYRPEIFMALDIGSSLQFPVPLAKEMAAAARERNDKEYAFALETAIRLSANTKRRPQAEIDAEVDALVKKKYPRRSSGAKTTGPV